MKARRNAVLSFAMILIAGCASGGASAPVGASSPAAAPSSGPPVTVENTTFAAALEIDLAKWTRTRSGCYYLDVIQGTGAMAAEGDNIVVDYTAVLPNAAVAEGGPGTPQFHSRLNKDVLVHGWVETIPGERVGGVRWILIPPAQGYGKRGSPSGTIPPNTVVLFEVKLLSSKP